MKNCRDIESHLSLYLDNLLSGDDKQAIEEHLKSCPQCMKSLDQLYKTRKLVNDLDEVEPPAWLQQKIMARVREESEKKNLVQKLFYPLRIKIPAQVFATVFIAVLAVYIYRAGEKQIREIVPSSVPAPVAEVQESQLTKSKIKTSADKEMSKRGQIIQKKAMPYEYFQETATERARDTNEQIIPGIKADEYDSAPSAKSVEPHGTDLEKKKENVGVVMKAGRSMQAQSSVQRQDILLKVDDISVAAGEVEKLLVIYEAKKITRQMMQSKAILTGEVRNQKIKDLMVRLKTIGQVEDGHLSNNNDQENISLVIEILND